MKQAKGQSIELFITVLHQAEGYLVEITISLNVSSGKHLHVKNNLPDHS